MPEISVIIPVYNVESYLPQCLDSLIDQTLKDIEIILIDDGSTDSSGSICDEYVARDSRIHVVHKRNEGLSAARNDGIKVSSAKYIMFVDPDDWVVPAFCERPFLTAKNNNADLVLFTFNKIYDNGKSVPRAPNIKSGFLSETEAIRFNTLFPEVWIGIYRRELFSGVWFPEGKVCEDIGTSHKLIHAANRICFIDEKLYNHRVGRPGSITTTMEDKGYSDSAEMRLLRANDLYDWGYAEFALNDTMYLLIKYGCSKYPGLVDMVRKAHASPEYNWKRKILSVVLRLSPVLFDFICFSARKRYSEGKE